MYGMMLVEPEGGLPAVDKEFAVLQSEIYASPVDKNSDELEFDYAKGVRREHCFSESVADNLLLYVRRP
jgi:hypothetical protein